LQAKELVIKMLNPNPETRLEINHINLRVRLE
jgi:hypothetical protein